MLQVSVYSDGNKHLCSIHLTAQDYFVLFTLGNRLVRKGCTINKSTCETSYLHAMINQPTVDNLWSRSILLKLYLNELIKSITFEELSPKRSWIFFYVHYGNKLHFLWSCPWAVIWMRHTSVGEVQFIFLINKVSDD